MKNRRIPLIRQLLKERSIVTQTELRQALLEQGVTVTQATLSRDIKTLGISKRIDEHGMPRYVLPEDQGIPSVSHERLSRVLRDAMVGMQTAQNLLVIRTLPGHAHAVGSQFDSLNWKDLIGTLAGDDTLLLIAKDDKRAELFRRRILDILE